MVAFGLVSSAIDLSLFALLLLAFDAGQAEFRSAWFVLSLLTECLALLVLRTWRRSWSSRPSAPLLAASAAVIAAGTVLPFTAAGTLLGLAPLPMAVLGAVAGLAAAYVLLNEAAKSRWRRHPSWLAT